MIRPNGAAAGGELGIIGHSAAIAASARHRNRAGDERLYSADDEPDRCGRNDDASIDSPDRRRRANRRSGAALGSRGNVHSSAAMIITSYAYARAGLVGNPSDGYFGKTIAFVIRNFCATVQLWESPHFEIVPTHGDLAQFDSVDSFLRDQRLHG